jgi:hypothetical protein
MARSGKRIVRCALWIGLFIAAIAAGTVADVLLVMRLSARFGVSLSVTALLTMLGFIFYALLIALFYWLSYKIVTAFEPKKVSAAMSPEQLSDLLGAISSLQVDNLEARQALIRESFQAQQGYRSRVTANCEIEVEPVQPEQD